MFKQADIYGGDYLENVVKRVCYDSQLNIEAYQFKGMAQSFPNHFHNYYVIGMVEKGSRFMQCKNREYNIKQGDIVIFNPYDNHGCVQNGSSSFNYIGLNIHKEILLSVSEKIMGEKKLYTFPENVIKNNKACYLFSSLYKMIISGQDKQKKEQVFLLLIKLLSEKYGKISQDAVMPHIYGVEMACLFIQKNWDRHITLEQLCKCSQLNQQALLRAFKKSKGITPYRYLQAVRIEKAKQLLKKGEVPAQAALQAGFTDQSHLSHFFKKFTGISPAMYRNIFKENQKQW